MNVEYEINKILDELSMMKLRMDATDKTIANIQTPVIAGDKGEYLYIDHDTFAMTKNIVSEALILNNSDELNNITDVVKGTIIVINEDLGFKYREYIDNDGKRTYTYDKYILSEYPEMYNKFYINTANKELWFIGKYTRYLISGISKIINI